MIGQNLADITHPEFSSKIADCLKPSVILAASEFTVEECVISQYRQFDVRFKPSVSYSSSPSHSVSSSVWCVRVRVHVRVHIEKTVRICLANISTDDLISSEQEDLEHLRVELTANTLRISGFVYLQCNQAREQMF